MRRILRPDQVDNGKTKVKGLLKANARIESLSDEELYVLQLMVEKELVKRESTFARRGNNRNLDLV